MLPEFLSKEDFIIKLIISGILFVLLMRKLTITDGKKILNKVTL